MLDIPIPQLFKVNSLTIGTCLVVDHYRLYVRVKRAAESTSRPFPHSHTRAITNQRPLKVIVFAGSETASSLTAPGLTAFALIEVLYLPTSTSTHFTSRARNLMVRFIWGGFENGLRALTFEFIKSESQIHKPSDESDLLYRSPDFYVLCFLELFMILFLVRICVYTACIRCFWKLKFVS